MAPTVCMADIPMPASDAPCVMRKYWQEREGNKYSRMCVRPLSMKNERWEAHCPEAFLQEARIPNHQSERLRIIAKRRRDLLEIIMRTLALVRRNQILQQRVNALRQETRHFVKSVINNRQSDVKTDSNTVDTVSSSTDEMQVDSTKQSHENTTADDEVTSTCISSDASDVSSN